MLCYARCADVRGLACDELRDFEAAAVSQHARAFAQMLVIEGKRANEGGPL